MSFLASLAKGFVRSAVNQIGRDGGKVISNKLYGDKHSTPIKNISTTDTGVYVNDITNEPISDGDLRIKIKEEGFKISYNISDMGVLLKIWGYILGIICSTILYAIYPIQIMLPFMLFIGVIILKYRVSSVSAYKYENIGMYSQDRRYRRGKRLVGYKKQRVSFLIPANLEEKKVIMGISILYTILAISMPILGYALYNLFK